MNHLLETRDVLRFPQLIQIYDYWTKLCGTRFAPALREIDPREISRVLPWVWLADVVDGGDDFGFRLGGEKIIQYVGKRLSGTRLNYFRGQVFFETMREAFHLCVSSKAPVIRGPTRSTLAERSYQDIQVLLLPLSDDGERVTQLFGGLGLVEMEQRRSA